MNALDQAIYGRLAAATALTSLLAGGTAAPAIYTLQAKDGAATPYVEFGLQFGGEDNFNATRMKNQLVRIKAISGGGTQTKATAGSIDAQVDVAMASALSISGWGTMFWLAREQDIEFTEVDEAKRTFFHVGGLYRLRYNEV